jgi:2-methylcitrate dehydratase PrpD
MPESTLTERLARFACGLSLEEFSEGQVQKLKTYLLDWLGSALAGQTQPPTRIMLQLAHALGGRPESTLIPDGSKGMCLMAALVNGASSHVMEMDDLHRESVFHPAAAILPAVLATAEREHVSGKRLIEGMAVGYEVGIRVAMAVGTSHYHYWHTTATCGTFGAAAGAAKIMGLDQERFAWALGSAGTQAAGLWEFLVESAMSKQLHPGKSAMDGLLAALLAQGGFTGAKRILEGEKGFFRATSQDFDEARCVSGLGESFAFERNSLKVHASCGHTHSAIDALLLATGGKGMGPEDVERVNVRVYQAAMDLLGKVEPATPYLAKFSLPFCLATALRYGRVGLEAFTPERLKDGVLLRLMERIHVETDDELSRSYPRKWPAKVELLTRDGQRLQGSNEHPKGDPESPLEEEEVIAKFKGLTQGLLSGAASEGIVERVMALEKVQDAAEILNLERGA